jgi:Protein of unknown function (DUF4236)
MGFRFQRRLKLFPGVRLNFSRGGISTTIGVRGASVTLGGTGAYVNLGIPGTGLSFRQRITPSAGGQPGTPPRPSNSGLGEQPLPSLEPPQPAPAPEAYPGALVAGAIRSAPVSTLTSVGLDELKKLINEAALRRVELTATVSADARVLQKAERRLRHARWFIVRLFTIKALPRLAERVVAAEGTLTDTRQKLAGCSVEIEFAFDQTTLNTFAALVRGFQSMAGCQRIWDITASIATNRFIERTTAQHRITRKPVRLDISRSEIIDTNYKALYFTNANGNDIYIYPGFVMMQSPSKDFALIDVRELQVKFSLSNFIEEEGVPTDAEVIGQTWQKANKDGSRDRRFAGNYQIPVVKYAEIELRSSTGLYEVYQFSSYPRALSFAQALTEYQKAVAVLAERSKDHSLMPLLAPTDDEGEYTDAAPALSPTHPTAFAPSPPRLLTFDLATLVMIIGALGGGGVYVARHPVDLETALRSMTQSRSSVVSVPTVATPPATERARQMPQATSTAKEIVYVQRSEVNVRAEPSAASPVVGHEHGGKELAVFQRRGAWAQVGEKAPAGWVYQSLLGAAPP